MSTPNAWCPECGPLHGYDGRGCCPTCGYVCQGPGADAALKALDDRAALLAALERAMAWIPRVKRPGAECERDYEAARAAIALARGAR